MKKNIYVTLLATVIAVCSGVFQRGADEFGKYI